MASTRIQKVLVAGPNGSLGQAVLKHLQEHKFEITLLTRDLDKTKQAYPGTNAFEASYETVDGLTRTLKDVGRQDALISLLNRDEVDSQITLIDAAIAAGIPHIIPSCFGIGTKHPDFRKLPMWETKVRMEDHVYQKAEEGAITFTGIQNGAFFDWALERGFFLNVKGDTPLMVFDGGDVPFSATIVDHIAQAVAEVLLKPQQYRNRMVFLHTAVITQNQLLGYAKELAPDREYKTIPLDTGELDRQAWERWNKGEQTMEVKRMWMPRVTFGMKMGLFEKTDNEELGIQQWDDEKVKQLIASYV